MKFHRSQHHAMATEFEVLIRLGELTNEEAAQVAHAVFNEVDRLEGELSRFRPGSDIWRVNHLKKGESCPVSLAAMDCLQLAQAVHAETAGAFDITVGPLMRVYRDAEGNMRPHIILKWNMPANGWG